MKMNNVTMGLGVVVVQVIESNIESMNAASSLIG